MNSLVIGDSSQLAYYFPEKYERVSSRNISEKSCFHDAFYDRAYLCFAEQRTFMEESDIFFDINVHYTIRVINFLKSRCNKIIVYGTSELWSGNEGAVTINTPMLYKETAYIHSKYSMALLINEYRNIGEMQNVIILHPFNFNSVYRKRGFLFFKIFDSIRNKKKIEIGDTYFYRDLIHPKYVVERSMLADEDEIVGSGRLTFVHDFIRDLYHYSGMKYEDYVLENFSDCTERKIFYLGSQVQLYGRLLEDTLIDIA